MGSVGSGNTRQKNIVTLRGKNVSLPEGLKYSDKVEVSDALKDFEEKRRNNKIEYAVVTRKYGSDELYSQGELKGGKGSIQIPNRMLEQGEEFSHIHPRSGDADGVLGGTFSKEDLDTFIKYPNVKVYRAVA